MPYGETNPTEDKKIERCVSDLMSDSKFKPRKGGNKKSAAIAVCKSSIMGGKMDKETFEYTPEDSEKYTKGTAITNVHVFKAGKYRGKTWTKTMVDKMVENFKKLKELAGFEPPVRVGHRTDNPVENAKSIIGYIENLRSDGNGNAYADLDIVDEQGLKDIKSTKFRKRSMEFGPYETNDGKVFDEVLWGLGWVDIPQVEKLAEVNVYSKPLKEEQMATKETDEEKKEEEIKKEEELEIENKTEDTTDDSKDDSTAGEDNAIDKDGEGEPKEENSEEDSGDLGKKEDEKKKKLEDEKKKKKSVKMEKDNEMVQLDKENYEKLLGFEKKVKELELEQRVSKIESLSKEAKILSANVDTEKEFALSLNDEQFSKYLGLKNSQPSFIKLDNEEGIQKSIEPTSAAQTEQQEEKAAQELAEKVTEKYKTK
jgi:hypothetical protein